jgi:4-amino-4-deoxy-L-arabinose transferase-like glycosyltransferase
LCTRLFWGWLVLRTAAWTLFATLTQPNAPLDLIEWLSWGHEWRWGYHKHPPFPAWVAEAFSYLSPGSVWGVYLASYLATAFCLWAAWRLGRELLPPRLALLSALSLEGIIFFTYDTAEFSNNVVLNACWAAVVLCGHRALRTGRTAWWLGTGLAVGLGLLSKYSLVFLLAALFVFLLCQPQARRCWGRPGPYLAALVALALFAPHARWMAQNAFITIRYGMERSDGGAGWLKHLKHPLLFALSQMGRLLPVFFLLLPLLSWRGRRRAVRAGRSFDRDYLLTAVLGPVALHLLYSLVTGAQLREIWGSPLWTFTGLLLLLVLKTDATRPVLARAWWRWGLVVVTFWVFALAKNYGSPALFGQPMRIHFPGKQLAEAVGERWRRCSDRALPLVAGECWLAGNVGCYAQPRPSVYFSSGLGHLVLDPKIVPWTGDEDLCARGGVLLWDAKEFGDAMPAQLRKRFPDAKVQEPVILSYACPIALAPARIGVAVQTPAVGMGIH